MIAIILMGLICCKTSSQKDPKEENIKACIERYFEGYNIPGLSVGIVSQNEIMNTFSFGMKDLSTNDMITERSIFHMASLSKPVTATAIMQLVENGKIKLDDPITTYLPYFELTDSTYGKITIRHILTHTSGMPDVSDYEWDNPQLDEGAAERYVKSLAVEKMIADVGERWRYSNMAYDVLADVIAKVTGTSFEDYVLQNILRPLEMTNSSFIPDDLSPKLRTKGHVWNFGTSVSNIYPYNRRHAPSSCLNSNIADMCNWIIANLNSGAFAKKQILDKTTHDMLITPQFDINDNRSIGLSWFIEDYKGIRTVSHEGSDLGYRSKLLTAPEQSIGIVVASNFNRTPVNEIAFSVLDILLGNEPEPFVIPIDFVIGSEITESGVEGAISTYRKLRNGPSADNYDFRENQLNRLGYRLIRAERFKDAVEILKLNVELFPNSANVYDSLGEAYMLNGERDLAIKFYEKTLELNSDNESAKEKLLELKSKHK